MIGLSGLIFNKVTLGLAVAAAVAWGYNVHRTDLMQQGYDKAMTEVQDREDARLREQIRETARLIGVVEGLNREHQDLRGQIDRFASRWADAQRLHDAQERDFERLIAAASSEAVRRYAQASDRNLERCRQDVARFSREAAEGSAAAYALKGYVDSVPACAAVPTP